jgi:predicted nucleic acid-binding protein
VTTLLFDTNTLSYWLKYPPAAAAKKATPKLALMKRVYERVAEVDTLYFSVLTTWEIERGYVDIGADRQLASFTAVVSKSIVVPLDDDVWRIAPEVWVAAKKSGKKPSDSDVLIAATARARGFKLVTSDANLKACADAQAPPIPRVDFADA